MARCSIAEIFENLEYGPAPESQAVANAWLDEHNRDFGALLRYTHYFLTTSTTEKLATDTLATGSWYAFVV